jgi:hypothetical protein
MEISSNDIKPLNNSVGSSKIQGSSESKAGNNANLNSLTSTEELLTQTKTYNIFSSTENVLRALSKITQPTQTLFPTANENGEVSVKTEDNFALKFDIKNEQWSITYPDGKQTRIWGDPHVEESDGDKWDFTKKSSFVFGNNKITVETTPIVKGVSYSQTVTIYNGDDRLTITDLNKNKPSIVAWKYDASSHDAALTDGTKYTLHQDDKGKDSWVKSRK